MELDEVSIEESSMMNSLSYSFQYSWTTRKKRTLKPFKSKGFSSSSSSSSRREEEEEEGRTSSKVFNRKRKHSRAHNDGSTVKRNSKRRRKTCKVEESGDEFEVIPKSDKEEQCYEDDDDCILGEKMTTAILEDLIACTSSGQREWLLSISLSLKAVINFRWSSLRKWLRNVTRTSSPLKLKKTSYTQLIEEDE